MKRLRDLTIGDMIDGLSRYRPFLATIGVLLLILVVLPNNNNDHDGASVAAAGSVSGAPTAAQGDGSTAAVPSSDSESSSGVAPIATPAAASAGAAAGTTGATAARKGAAPSPGAAPTAARSAAASGPAAAAVGAFGLGSVGSPEALAAKECDPKTGRIKIPSVFAAPCVRPWPGGDNGGATAQGVTGDKIKVLLYVPAPSGSDNALVALGVGDTPEQYEAVYRDLFDLLNHHVQLHGRRFEFVAFRGSGSGEEPERADAITIATKVKPFAVVTTGPSGSTVAQEVAARGIVAISHFEYDTDTFAQRAPHLWNSGFELEHTVTVLAEYVGRRLHGHNATWASDALMKTQPRKFGLVYNSSPGTPLYMSNKTLGLFSGELAKYGAAWTDQAGATFDVATLQSQARTIIARFKEKGISTIVPPINFGVTALLTQEATRANYFPEWIVTPVGYGNTAVLAKVMDPAQWKAAFGVTGTGVPVPPDKSQEGPGVYRWHTGKEVAGSKAYATVAWGQLSDLARGITLAGPRLTAEAFRDGLFADAPLGGSARNGVTTPQRAYGKRAFWSNTTYSGGSDVGEVWWDATASGYDEAGNQSTGLYRFADGGRRLQPGALPATEPKAFDTNGTVTNMNEVPPAERVQYPHEDPY